MSSKNTKGKAALKSQPIEQPIVQTQSTDKKSTKKTVEKEEPVKVLTQAEPVVQKGGKKTVAKKEVEVEAEPQPQPVKVLTQAEPVVQKGGKKAVAKKEVEVEAEPVKAEPVKLVESVVQKGGKKGVVKKVEAEPVKLVEPVKQAKQAKQTKQTKQVENTEPVVQMGGNDKIEVEVEAEEDEEEQENESKLRYFKLIYNEEIQGRYCGKKPKQAANKAFSSIIKDIKKSGNQHGGVNVDISFSIRECTRNSKHKEYKYVGVRKSLNNPVKVEINNDDGSKKEITYNFQNKIQKAPKA